MQYITKNVTILNGAAITAEIDLGGYDLAAVQMPATWTAANLTFQAATATGGTYQDVFDDGGTEVSVTAAAAHAIPFNTVTKDLAGFRWIKIRSGTTASPVNQGADRIIVLILRTGTNR